MSSLAYDDVQEGNLDAHSANTDFTPVLHVVHARHRSRAQMRPSSLATDIDDVVSIGGRFTISF